MTKPAGSFARRLEAAWLRRGLLAWLLLPLALLYGVAASLRRLLYARGLLQTEHLDVPVLIVGNLIAGGAGKTPTVLACVDILRSLGYTPGVISRGYRPGSHPGANHTQGHLGEATIQHTRQAGKESTSLAPLEVTAASSPARVGDEPLLLHLRSGVPVFVGADRPASARALRTAHPRVDIIVSDDGLQHLRLGRDAVVLVFDERGTGNGWLLPAGPLREPLPRSLPPHTVVLYNARHPSTALPGFAARPTLSGAVALADWWAGNCQPSMATLLGLRGRPVVAVAGVARPERFFTMLESLGLTIERLPLPDHFDYAQPSASASTASSLPWPSTGADVVVTEKDAVKLRPEAIGNTRVWVVALDFEPEPAFRDALSFLLPRGARDTDLPRF